jgi:hypothetical protein
VEHHVRVIQRDGAQPQPFGFYDIHASPVFPALTAVLIKLQVFDARS